MNRIGFVFMLLAVMFNMDIILSQNNSNLEYFEAFQQVPTGFQIIPGDVQPLEPSAILDIRSENTGVLIPRMAQEQRLEIAGPAEGLMVYQNDGQQGFYYFSDEVWEKVQNEDEAVPLGTVIEWWRPNASFPVPEGYVICDGSTVTDPESPYDGVALPDLIDNFVRGVTDTALIGETFDGNHDHVFDPPQVTSSEDGAHTHPLIFGASTSFSGSHHHTYSPGQRITSSYTHNHVWSFFNGNPSYDWNGYNFLGNTVQLMDWTDGLDADGSDYFPISSPDVTGQEAYYTKPNSHNHVFNFNPIISDNAGTHDHPLGGLTPNVSMEPAHSHELNGAPKTSTSANIVPPFHGLVKIIRIK